MDQYMLHVLGIRILGLYVLGSSIKKTWGVSEFPQEWGVPLDSKIQCKLLQNAQEVIFLVGGTVGPPTGLIGYCAALHCPVSALYRVGTHQGHRATILSHSESFLTAAQQPGRTHSG